MGTQAFEVSLLVFDTLFLQQNRLLDVRRKLDRVTQLAHVKDS